MTGFHRRLGLVRRKPSRVGRGHRAALALVPVLLCDLNVAENITQEFFHSRVIGACHVTTDWGLDDELITTATTMTIVLPAAVVEL